MSNNYAKAQADGYIFEDNIYRASRGKREKEGEELSESILVFAIGDVHSAARIISSGLV